jgi:hypothetical protein
MAAAKATAVESHPNPAASPIAPFRVEIPQTSIHFFGWRAA